MLLERVRFFKLFQVRPGLLEKRIIKRPPVASTLSRANIVKEEEEEDGSDGREHDNDVHETFFCFLGGQNLEYVK